MAYFTIFINGFPLLGIYVTLEYTHADKFKYYLIIKGLHSNITVESVTKESSVPLCY